MIDVETRIRRRTRKSKNNEWQNNGAGKIVQWIKITMKIIIRRMKVMIGIARINLKEKKRKDANRKEIETMKENEAHE